MKFEELTITDAAKLKNVSRATVYKWIDANKVDYTGSGKTTRVIRNSKLEKIAVKKDLQHIIKEQQQQIDELREMILSLINDVKELKKSNVINKEITGKRNVTNLKLETIVKKRSTTEIEDKKCNVTKSTNMDKKRKMILEVINQCTDFFGTTGGNPMRAKTLSSSGSLKSRLIKGGGSPEMINSVYSKIMDVNKKTKLFKHLKLDRIELDTKKAEALKVRKKPGK